jgi:hypothetical protein
VPKSAISKLLASKVRKRGIFSHGQNARRLWFRQIEYLPGEVAGRRRRGQRFAAPGACKWIMVDGGIGLCNLAKRLAGMAVPTAGLLAGRSAQAPDPWRLLQPVAGGRFAAVVAVQPETALQLSEARQKRISLPDEMLGKRL